MNQSIHDDEALVIDLNQLYDILRLRAKLVLMLTLLFVAGGVVFALFFHQEKYASRGTLIFTGAEPSNVITTLDTVNRLFEDKGMDASPLKNQEELLASRRLALDVMKRLGMQNLKLPFKSADELQDKFVSFDHIKGTDFIEITATAPTPLLAKTIAQTYIDAYQDLVDDVSLEPIRQQKVLFENQANQAEQDLEALASRIQLYQQQNNIVDIDAESQKKALNFEALKEDSKDLEAQLSEKRGQIAQIRKQLKLQGQDTASVLHAVASGQDPALTDLQNKLQAAQKDYEIKALTFAPTNPDMVQLEHQIDVLKRQITDQQIMTAGQSMGPRPMLIKDQVRSDLVSRLATAEDDMSALSSKLATLQHQRVSMESELKNMPEQQLGYARLLLDQKNKESVLTRLKEKLAEVQIQEAAVRKKIQPMDTPNTNSKPLFPNKWHIILLSAVAGLFLSSLGALAHGLATQRQVRPETIERAVGLPVLSLIPWIPQMLWQQYRSRGLLEVTAANADPQMLKAYQDLALNLKAQCRSLDKNALVFSSTFQEAGHSVILSNLAFCLAQSGDRVLLIDANLRKPRLQEVFGHSLNYEKGLPEVINMVSESLYRQDRPDPAELLPKVMSAATPAEIHPNIYYLNAGVALTNTFEFLNSKGFGVLIGMLKGSYDWVILDAPPFLQVPDAAVLLGHADGLLLLVEKDADEGQVKAVKRKVERLHSCIVGVVLRRVQD